MQVEALAERRSQGSSDLVDEIGPGVSQFDHTFTLQMCNHLQPILESAGTIGNTNPTKMQIIGQRAKTRDPNAVTTIVRMNEPIDKTRAEVAARRQNEGCTEKGGEVSISVHVMIDSFLNIKSGLYRQDLGIHSAYIIMVHNILQTLGMLLRQRERLHPEDFA